MITNNSPYSSYKTNKFVLIGNLLTSDRVGYIKLEKMKLEPSISFLRSLSNKPSLSINDSKKLTRMNQPMSSIDLGADIEHIEKANKNEIIKLEENENQKLDNQKTKQFIKLDFNAMVKEYLKLVKSKERSKKFTSESALKFVIFIVS